MRKYSRSVLIGGAMVLAATLVTASAAAGQEKRISVSNAWVKLPPAGDTQAMAFATFRNSTAYDVYVASASADVAGRIELRDASRSGDLALKSMEFFTVPAQETADMDAKGAHLLLLDLKRPLKEGETITLILKTEQGSMLEVPAIVKKE